MIHDNGYSKEQRAYDRQEPPEYYTEEHSCPDCDGDGTMFDSDSGEILCCKKCGGHGVLVIKIT